MKISQLFPVTSKDTPSGETATNAQLLIRAGFVHKELAGVYSYMPFGLRTLSKIKKVIQEEMAAVQSLELLMSSICPRENWERTGRWSELDVLYQVEASHGEIALSPTHEETVTPLVQRYLSSPKHFPACVYQIQTKFRNEPRAKSGVLRGREFIMKDAYSFHTSTECLDEYYQAMTEAYIRIFQRLGLGDITLLTKASGGTFAKFSHEFQTLCDVGEDDIYTDTVTQEHWNKEIAQGLPDNKNTGEALLPLEERTIERGPSIQASVDTCDCQAWQVLKTVVYRLEDGQFLLACIRGDLEVNPLLLSNFIDQKLTEVSREELTTTGFVHGFISPINLPDSLASQCVVIADQSLKTVHNFITGANAPHRDYFHANVDRDFHPDHWANFAVPTTDFTSLAGNPLVIRPAAEVGNIFKLKNKYSAPFSYRVPGPDGKPTDVLMGCYGIGVSRLMGVIVETHHDDQGIRWPHHLAPFHVYLAPIGRSDAPYTIAEQLYTELQNAGFEVLLDDRREKKVGPGQKFADHELIGLPVRVVISKRTLEQQQCEIVERANGNTHHVALSELSTTLDRLIQRHA